MESFNVKTAITLVCLGFILVAVSIPLYLGKIKMNCFYGFRIRNAFESEENYHKINRYEAKALTCWSVVIMPIGIVYLYIEPPHVLIVAEVSFVFLLVPLALTFHYARRV